MQAAQRIQLDTLPAADSLHDPRLELAAFMEPALEVGGDLYDFYKLDDRRLFFMLGDVSGKGLPASIFMAVSKALCKSTMLRSGDADLGTLMMRMNEEVSRDNPAALFVTVFAGLLDLDSGELHYCNAGQDNPWLKGARDGAVTRLSQGGGPPLCVVEDFEYGVSRRTLGRGDIICIVSDGITEAQDGRTALYGAARVESVLSSGCNSSREMLEMIRADVRKFVGDSPQADDMTVLTVRWV